MSAPGSTGSPGASARARPSFFELLLRGQKHTRRPGRLRAALTRSLDRRRRHAAGAAAR